MEKTPYLPSQRNKIWKKNYLPPWDMIYNLLEVIVLFIYFAFITCEVVYYYFTYRTVFIDAFYPDFDDGSPLADFQDLSDYFDDLTDSMDKMFNDSFMNVDSYQGMDYLVFNIDWKNGSTTVLPDAPDVDLDFFKHINTITPDINFVIYSYDSQLGGCSHWHIKTEVTTTDGISQFTVNPWLHRSQCEKSYIDDLNLINPPLRRTRHPNKEKILENLIKMMRKKPHKRHKTRHIKTTEGFKAYPKDNIKRPIRHIPKREQSQKLYMTLLILLIIHAVGIIFRLKYRISQHKTQMNTSKDYRKLTPSQRYHYSIGYWFTIDIVNTIYLGVVTTISLIDIKTATQFPSQYVTWMMCLGTMFSMIRLSQWFGDDSPCYQNSAVLRDVFGRLVFLTIGTMPMVAAFFLFGIFAFGLSSTAFDTIRNIVQRFITSGNGDSIDDFFIVTDDGTTFNSWLSFFYVSAITSIGMWIIFTSCTASVMLVHEHIIVKHDTFWNEEHDDTVSDESS